MGTLETIILVVVSVMAFFFICAILFSKRKKKDKSSEPKKEKEKKPEPKVEPAIAPTKKPVEEKEEEPPKVEMPEQFKIVRRKSEVKINKKALKTDSRNPTITKVFDRNGKPVGEKIGEGEDNKEAKTPDNTDVVPVITHESIGHYGTREPHFDDLSKPAVGAPNRAPIIGDRTNFASHLVVGDDNNLAGVMGTGVNKAIETSAKQGEDLNEKTQSMVDSVRKNVLGQDPLDFLGIGMPDQIVYDQKKSTGLKDIDAKTLVIAEAINNPKHKRK